MPVIRPGDLPLASAVPEGLGLCRDTNGDLVWDSGGRFTNLALANKSKSFNSQFSAIRVATFGDSTANCNGLLVGDISLFNLPFPGTGFSSVGMHTDDKFALQLFYPGCYLVANGGVSGDTSGFAQSATRTSQSKNISDIINLRPDVVIMRMGINDVDGVVSGTYRTVVDTYVANMKGHIAKFLSAGVAVIFEGIFGFSFTTTDQALSRAASLECNATMIAWIQSLNNPMAAVIQVIGLTCDSTGAYLPGLSTDGKHLNVNGVMPLSQVEANILTSMFGQSPAIRYPGINLVANSLYEATSVQAYGTQANGFVISASNGTRQKAKIEVINGKRYQTWEIANSSGSANTSITLNFTASSAGIVSGDIVGVEFDFMLAGVTNPAPPLITGGSARFDLNNGVGRVFEEFNLVNTGTYQPSDTVYWHVSFNPFQINATSASLGTSQGFYVGFGTPDITTFKLGVALPRVVKLNQPVVTY